MATLSAGEFVGLVSDDPEQPIEQKIFHCKLLKEKKAGEKKVDLPIVQKINTLEIQQVYLQIKHEIEDTLQAAVTRVNRDPSQAHLRIRKDPLL